LFNFDQFSGCRLCQVAFGDKALKLHHQRSLELMFFGIRQAEISENVAGAFFRGLAAFSG
jgi:hypothetical protein